jgi:PAS domain S-box-containing protein
MRRETRARDLPAPDAGVMEHLRALAYFDPFQPAELDEIARLCRFGDFAAGESVIHEGDPSDGCVYILLSGRVSVSVNDKFILALGRRGDIVGEMGLIGEERRSATVRAELPSRFLVLSSAGELMEGSDHSYRLRYYFTRMFTAILADKLRITSERAKLYEEAILEHRRAEAHSADLEERIAHNLRQIRLYSHLVESAHDPILIAGLEGAVEHANPAFGRVFACAPQSLLGLPLGALLGLEGGGPRGWSEISDRARREGWSGEVAVCVEPEAERIPAECAISLVRGERQAPLAFAVVLRDLRERKAYEARILRQQQELEAAYRELQTVDRLKDHFLTRVSHELRTPLTSVLGSLEMLTTAGMVEPEQQAGFLDMVFREARHLASRVDKLLAISKIESGQMAFNFEAVDPEVLIDGAIAQVRPLASQKGIPLLFERGGPLLPVTLDAERMRTVLVELLENAVKFTDQGAVRVGISQSTGETLIRIEDTGKGIDSLSPELLFETLGQVRDESASAHGLGLGLPLSRLIVTAHSGTLGVDGKPGGGSTFWIRLPAAASAGRESPPGEAPSS